MDTVKYQQYCKDRRKPFYRRPHYASFSETVWPAAIIGAVAGLVLGIWKNFFPLPETVFRIIGAVMFTLTYTMGGAICGLILTPILHLGRRLITKLKHIASVSASTRRLSENPIVQEVLRCIQDGHVSAVIITESCIRLYDRILDERYCDEKTDIHLVQSIPALDQAEANFRKKENWAVYDRTCMKELTFSLAGYGNMDDDTQMALANYLLQQCKEWGGVYHHAFGFYEAVSSSFTGKFTYNSHTGSITAHKDVDLTTIQRTFYRDYFLFRLDIAYAMASERKQKADAMQAQIKRW